MKYLKAFFHSYKALVITTKTFGIILIAMLFLSCASTPESFIKGNEPSWASIEIRDNLTLDDAWQ